MNAADQAIEEIRVMHRRISAEFNHDIAKSVAHLQEMEKESPDQVRRGKELLAKRDAERRKFPEKTADDLTLREKPKS